VPRTLSLFLALSPPLLIYFFTFFLLLIRDLNAFTFAFARARGVDRSLFLSFSLSRVLYLGSLTKKVFAPVPLRYSLHMSYAN